MSPRATAIQHHEVAAAHLAAGWGRTVNVSINAETTRRRGFSPYGPSKAALESATIIWAQDLAGSGVTVNALLPGGKALTGMIPAATPITSGQSYSTLRSWCRHCGGCSE